MMAVRRLGERNKGAVIATCFACPDLAIGLASPLLGSVVAGDSIKMAFLWSAILVTMVGPVASLARNRS